MRFFTGSAVQPQAQSAQPAPVMPSGRRVRRGAILFDDPDIAMTGFVCVAGEEPRTIQSIADVSSDAVYITNLGFAQIHQAGLAQSPKYRAADYLRTRVNHILTDLGLQNEPPEEQVRVLAEVFDRVMQLAMCHLDIAVPPRSTLMHGVMAALGVEYPNLDPQTTHLIKSASQSHVFAARSRREVEAIAGQETCFMGFRAHRQTYAQSLLTTIVPMGEFRRVKLAKDLSSDQLIEQALKLSEEKPVMLPVVINKFYDETTGLLINHGAGALDHKRSTRQGTSLAEPNMREIVSTPELVMLIQLADITTTGPVYAASGFAPNTLRQAGIVSSEFDPFNLQGEEWIDYAVGLYMEILWRALTKLPQSAEAMWLQAMDRVETFIRATRLAVHEDVAAVTSYSTGRVWAVLSADQPHTINQPYSEAVQEKATRISLDTGLIPPMFSRATPNTERYQLGVNIAIEAKAKSQPLAPHAIEQMSAILGLREHIFTSSSAHQGA